MTLERTPAGWKMLVSYALIVLLSRGRRTDCDFRHDDSLPVERVQMVGICVLVYLLKKFFEFISIEGLIVAIT